MQAPLIGITTARNQNEHGHPTISVMESYVRAVADAGGAPLIVPLGLSDDLLKAIISRLDGLLLTGGGDIEPELFNGEAHSKVSLVDRDRDRVELRIFLEALRWRKPFFGICRGLQVVNVALGGSLLTHIADQHPQALEHCFYPNWPREYIAHTVQITPGSRLEGILKSAQAQVNSQHHQAIKELGAGLQPSAHAEDGLIEAVELAGYPFGLAVQWHPEWLQDQPGMRSLFKAFTEAARMKHTGQDVLPGA
jgi:putative glutamine amidotransferase